MTTFYIVVLNILPLFVIYSRLVSGLESTAVHEIRKYKLTIKLAFGRLICVHRYHYNFVGLESVGVDRATVTVMGSIIGTLVLRRTAGEVPAHPRF